ncbi:S66 peptidase family protein [Vallitalea pronyensis]
MMIKPKAIQPGDTIGVIAPASPLDKRQVEQSKSALETLGFHVVMGKSCYQHHGYLAGRDQIRAKDVNDMFSHDDVKGIINLRGGYGTPRILSMLDYPFIKHHPKVFIGYSDITAIHIALHQLCGLVTFHGPMVGVEILRGMDAFTKKSFFNQISGHHVDRIHNPKNDPIKTLYGGTAEGPIIGGNLTLITSTLGTPYEIDTKGKILFMEEVGERPYKVDRLLTQLKHAGKLKDAQGILLGNFKNCEPQEKEMSHSLQEVFEELIKPLHKPTLYHLKAGHCRPNITLPFGVRVHMDAYSGIIKMMERGTIQGYENNGYQD